MSKPQPDQPKKLKRPRGLLGSRKAGANPSDSEPVSKKARAEDDSIPQDPEELKVQDWQDLGELFENALDTLHGTSWTSAVPLVRGVLHECARLVSVYNDPTLIYSPLEGEPSPNFATTPASAFYTIYASAWLLMGTLAQNEPTLLTEGEPKDPLEYILSALAACEKGQQALDARGQPKTWDLELTWGRTLIFAAQQLAENDSDEDAQTSQDEPAKSEAISPDVPTALNWGFEHLSYAIEHRPAGIPEDERPTANERFARVLLEAGQGILAATEGLQHVEEEGPQDTEQLVKYLRNAYDLFVRAEQLPGIPPEISAQSVLGAAQAGLAIGSSLAETLEDEDDTESEKENELKSSAIKSLRDAVERFDSVRKLNQPQKGSKPVSIDEEEIKPLLQEALVTLATLLPEGSEQDTIYGRYQDEGGVLDDE